MPTLGGGSEMNSFGDAEIFKKGEVKNDLVGTYQMFFFVFLF
jgi:hypothetical protein